jgi:hypothetical protein
VPSERTREVTHDPGASADTPVRVQGRGGSLPGSDPGHPLHSAGGHGTGQGPVKMAASGEHHIQPGSGLRPTQVWRFGPPHRRFSGNTQAASRRQASAPAPARHQHIEC